jgi:hypothetical protein
MSMRLRYARRHVAEWTQVSVRRCEAALADTDAPMVAKPGRTGMFVRVGGKEHSGARRTRQTGTRRTSRAARVA